MSNSLNPINSSFKTSASPFPFSEKQFKTSDKSNDKFYIKNQSKLTTLCNKTSFFFKENTPPVNANNDDYEGYEKTPPSSPTKCAFSPKKTSVKTSPKRPRVDPFSPTKQPYQEDLTIRSQSLRTNLFEKRSVRVKLFETNEDEENSFQDHTTATVASLAKEIKISVDFSSTPVPFITSEQKSYAILGDKIASGNFRQTQLSLMFTDTSTPDNQEWVVCSTQEIKSQKSFDNTQAEGRILKRINDELKKYPFVTTVFTSKDSLYISGEEGNQIPKKHILISDYYNGGSLNLHLSQLNAGDVDLIIPQLFDAVCFLHQAHILHSDIKADNILVKIDPVTKEIKGIVVADFGHSCDMNNPEDRFFKDAPKHILTNEFIGKLNTKAKGSRLALTEESYKEDVYALGLLLKKILENCPTHPLNKDKNFQTLLNKMTITFAKDRIDIFNAKDLFLKIRPETKFYYDIESKI